MPTTSKFLLLLTSSPSPSLLRPLFSLSHRGFRSPPQTFSFPLKLSLKPSSSFSHRFHSQINSNPFPPPQSPWPEFSHFVNHISASGYFGKFEDFPSPPHGFSFPHEFVNACLGFAQERGYLIGRLSRRDIDVVVGNGNANLFENGNEALTRMKAFLSSQSGAVLNADSGPMVDLMKILLSCASNFIYSENSNLHNREFLESSVRNLFNELAHLSCNASEPHVSGSSQNQFSDSNRQMSGSFQNHFSDRSGQISRPLQQNIEMKRGDWICPRCRFMNFARNTKCLECEAVRPKRQLTGGEWECPQCDFFNYGRNTVCLRCDCKRPGEVSHGISDSGSGLGYGRDNYANNADIDKRLAENEEKAQRWFSKISQMDSTSDMSSTIEDEDFPEIMPLRKGVNRFVVSTRKTPLERRLTDARYRRNSSYAGDSGISNAQGLATNNQTPRQALDDIMGRRFAASNTQQNSRADTSYSVQQQHGAPKASSSNDVPFVPLSADMFAKKTENEKIDESSKVEADKYRPLSSAAGEQAGSDFGCNDYDKSGHSWHPSNQSLSNEQEKQTKQSDRWFERVAKLDNVTDPASANPDEEFPETMPMRKGENRFVVSKKKDRSLSSPMYKRQMAMEQANNTNYVPFVPFPPDYFAKKDTQQLDGASMTNKVMGETSNYSTQANLSGKSEDIGARTSPEAEEPIIDNQQYNTVSWNSNSQEHVNQITTGTAGGLPTSVTSTQNVDPQFNMSDNRSSGFSWNEDSRGQRNAMANSQQSYFQKGGNNNNIGCSYSQNENFNQTGNSERSKPQTPENENTSSSWSGKSLEGSLVKEPDPLDMSEEAKAERWFRRVAQIKDISELSQIPDEDFPSIMPMRKGVNRFVVSKRKTPLERRLTSTSYRKNLPKVRSDPVKENDSS